MSKSLIDSTIGFPVPALAVDRDSIILVFNSLFTEVFSGDPEPDSKLSSFFGDEIAGKLEIAKQRKGSASVSVMKSGDQAFRIEILQDDDHTIYLFFEMTEFEKATQIGHEATRFAKLRFDALAVPPDQLRDSVVEFADLVKLAFPPPLIDKAMEIGDKKIDLTSLLIDAAKCIGDAIKESGGKIELEIPENAEAMVDDEQLFRKCFEGLADHLCAGINSEKHILLRCHELNAPRGFYNWLIDLVESDRQNPADELCDYWRDNFPQPMPDRDFKKAGSSFFIHKLPEIGAAYCILVNQPRD
jgi:hypothetical protein